MAKSSTSTAEAECSAFFAFTGLMSEIRDRFDRALDLDQGDGVFSILKRLESLIARHLPRFSEVLGRFEVSLQFFALRWVVTLCVQDFELPDVLRLWDSLFAKSVSDFLPFVCLAMCAQLWEKLQQLEGEVEFCDLMPILQSNPRDYIEGGVEIDALITAAEVLSLEDKARDAALRNSSERAVLRDSGGSQSRIASWLSYLNK